MKVLFPTILSSPEFGIFDSSCRLLAHITKQQDRWFLENNMRWVVDAFHYRTKHKKTDELCRDHCNPAIHPELKDEKGKWIFNSSVCEQTNVWIRGFHPMCRVMLVDRYNFFLDEVIKRRNRWLVKELEKSGKNPRLIPLEALGIIAS